MNRVDESRVVPVTQACSDERATIPRLRPRSRWSALARSMGIGLLLTAGLLASGLPSSGPELAKAKPADADSVDSLDAPDVTTLPIKLNFVVLDEAGLPVPGASVKVWQDLEDPDDFVHKQVDKALAQGKPAPAYADVAPPKDPNEPPGAFHLKPDIRQELGEVISDSQGKAVVTIDPDGIQANVADGASSGLDPHGVPFPPLVESSLVTSRYLNYTVEPGVNAAAVTPPVNALTSTLKVMASGMVQAFAMNPHYTGMAPSAEEIESLQALILDHSMQVITATLKPRALLTTEELAQVMSQLGDETAAAALRKSYPQTTVSTFEAGPIRSRSATPYGEGATTDAVDGLDQIIYGACSHRTSGDGPIVKGMVWADLIHPPDRIRQSVEPAIPQTIVELRNSSNQAVRTCFTNGTGRYAWAVGNLPTGQYRVHFVAPDSRWQSSGEDPDIEFGLGYESYSHWFPRPYYNQVREINAGFKKDYLHSQFDEKLVAKASSAPAYLSRVHLLPGMTGSASAAVGHRLKFGVTVSPGAPGMPVPMHKFMQLVIDNLPTSYDVITDLAHVDVGQTTDAIQPESPIESSVNDLYYEIGMELSCKVVWLPGIEGVNVWDCTSKPDGINAISTRQNENALARPIAGTRFENLAAIGQISRPAWPSTYSGPQNWHLPAMQVENYERELWSASVPVDLLIGASVPVCPPCAGIWALANEFFGWSLEISWVQSNTFDVSRTITDKVWSYASDVLEYANYDLQGNAVVVPGVTQFRDCQEVAGIPVPCALKKDVPYMAYAPTEPILANCELWYREAQSFGPHVYGPSTSYKTPYTTLAISDNVEITKDGGSGTCHAPPCTRAKFVSKSKVVQNAENKLGQFDWTHEGIQIADSFEFEGSDLQLYRGSGHRLELTVIQGLTGVHPIQANSGQDPNRFGGEWLSPNPHRFEYESAVVQHGATPGHRYAELRSVNMGVWAETPNPFNLISGRHVLKGRSWHGNDFPLEHVLERTTEFQNPGTSYWDESAPGYTGRPGRGFKHCFGGEQ